MADDAIDDNEFRRLRWQCRRGMRELDVILSRYLETDYRGAGAQGRQVFQALLRRQDPEIASWILGREVPADPPTAALVERLKTLYSGTS